MKRALLWLAHCIFWTSVVSLEAQTYYESYTFTTIAGVAPGSADGVGNAARFFEPSGIAVDSTGNIYLSDTFNHTIRKVTPAGVVTTLAGLAGVGGNVDGTGSAARFWYPTGLSVDNTGNLYVASSNAIRKITPSGIVTTFAGSLNAFGSTDGTGTAARFTSPNGVTIDAAGNLYVGDGGNHTIRKITPSAVVTTVAGLAGASGSADGIGNAARFNNPRGVTVDNPGNVYVADAYNHTIRKITPAGTVSTLAGLPGSSGSADGSGSAARFLYPWSLSVDGVGNIFVADAYNNTVRRVTSAGVVSTVAGSASDSGSNDGTGTAARFNLPQALTIDSSGTIMVADTHNHTIRKLTPSFSVSTFAGTASIGSNDGTASAARFRGPSDVAVDSAGNKYVADQSNNTVRKITPAGVVSTLAGLAGTYGSSDGTGSAARFATPTSVAVDGSSNVYVADVNGHSIRKITPDGTVTTLAGLGGSAGSANGQGGAARFYFPAGLAVDASANIYVGDSGNHTVRKVTPAGAVTTLAGFAGSPGSADGQGSTARFNNPTEMAVDTMGNIYVADTSSHTIRKITPAGLVSTLAGHAGTYGSGDGTAAAAYFYAPRGIAADSSGNVYVGDTNNNLIRKITTGGVVTTLGGVYYQSGSNNAAGSSARFWSPQGMAIDASGTLYLADNTNNAIRAGVRTPPPANDSFTNALAVAGNSGSFAGNNEAASLEPGEPPHAGNTGGHSLWFTWTAPQTGSYTFQVTSSTFPVSLAIYTGSQLNALTPVASATLGGAAAFHGAAGTTYHIAVDGLNGDSGSFIVTWNLTAAAPPNDDFVNAQPITATSGSVSGTTTEATVQPGEPNHAGVSGHHSIWYTWTAPQDGGFVFDTAGSSTYGTVLAIYTGSAVSALTLVGESPNFNGTSRVTFQAVAGTAYKIALDMWQSYYHGPTVLNWHAANPPANDNFADAQEISGSTGSVTGSNVDATKESGEPAYGFDPGGASIWYQWTAPATGRFQFDAAGTFTNSSSALLGIYTGPAVNSLRGLARGLGPARAQVDVVAGGLYFIAVDGLNYGATASDIVLSWQALPGQQRTYQPYAFSTLAGNPPANIDGAGNNARFNRSNAVAVGTDGNLYIADTRNHTIRKVTSSGGVTTLAGSAGERGSADGVGAAARFWSPSGIAVGPDGFVYVADSANNTVRKISPAGLVSTLAGSAGFFGTLDGAGNNALFEFPIGITVDASGTVFVTDSYNHTIRTVTPAGQVSTIAGSPGMFGSSDGTGADARFYNPTGLEVDSSGNIYVADQYNYTIRKITPGGAVSTFAGMAGVYGFDDGVGSAATFDYVSDVTVDGDGNLFVADLGNQLIRKITPEAAVTTLAGTVNVVGSDDGIGGAARFNFPGGVAVTAAGILYVADTGNSTVRLIDTAAAVSTLAGLASPGTGDGSGSAARFNGSLGAAVDGEGNIYVADTTNHVIRKITPAGVTSTLAGFPGMFGSANGTGSAARFRGPRGVVVDPSGNVYVADSQNNMIRKITPAGVVSTVAGATSSGSIDGTGTAARFRGPGAITIDSAGNLYVADTTNNTVRRITPGAVVTTLAGTALLRGSADGTGSAARFNTPRGITIDGAGNLFVTDTSNHTIRKVTFEGVVTTFVGTAEVYGDNDGTGANARFYFPYSIAAGTADNLFVADRSNHLIRKITGAGVVSTVAGSSRQNGSQNGGGSAARFDSPSGIAAGPGGKLYIADTNNNVIRTGVLALQASSAASRKLHGAAGDFDLSLPLAGTLAVESRSGGASNNYQIVLTFGGPVTFSSVAVTAGAGTISDTSGSGTTVVTVNLTGVTNAQRITLTLYSVSDGTITNDVTVQMGVLVGDTNGDGFVNAGDSLQTRNRSGQTTDATNFRSDVNSDGFVNSGDTLLVRGRSGSALP